MTPLRDQLANRWSSQWRWLADDIDSVATLALLDLLTEIELSNRKFDDSEHLARYANVIIRGRILNYIRHEHRRAARGLTIEPKVISKSEPEMDYLDLSPEERQVIEMRMEGYTDDEIAVKLNRGRTYVSRLRTRIGQRYEQANSVGE